MLRLPKHNLLKQKSAPTRRFFKTFLSLFFIGCLSVLSLGLKAQKHDFYWLFGPQGVVHPSTPYEEQFCTNHIDFNTVPIGLYGVYGLNDLSTCGTAFSDKSGSFIFYTDGLSIYNRNYVPMPNGSGLNPGTVANQWISAGISYPSIRGVFILPAVGNDSLFYVFHNGVVWDSVGVLGVFSNCLYYTIVNMNLNAGLGDVTIKNHVIIQDTIIGGGGMAACRHANGRDWWLVVQNAFTNCFHKYLLTPHGLDTLQVQCIGDTLHFNQDRGSNTFAPDGSKYVWSNPFERLSILDFDRCTGEFSNFRRIYVVDSLTEADSTTVIADGVSISPNSRFLYLSTGSELRQYDLQASDIAGSEIVIANTYKDEEGYTLWLSQLAPDGKIYINQFKADTALHVIHNPDQAGFNCNFERKAIHLPCLDPYTLPYYPNYLLGPLSGSGCDTLDLSISEQKKEKQLNVYPNPATVFVTIDYGFTNWNKGNVELQIINGIGQLMYEGKLPPYSGFQKVNVGSFARGIYLVTLKQQGQVIGNAWFVKE